MNKLVLGTGNLYLFEDVKWCIFLCVKSFFINIVSCSRFAAILHNTSELVTLYIYIHYIDLVIIKSFQYDLYNYSFKIKLSTLMALLMTRHWASTYIDYFTWDYPYKFRARFIALSLGDPSVASVVGPCGALRKLSELLCQLTLRSGRFSLPV